ncbi:unnamed protein product, partial [Rotaria magnacalcarata]
NFVQAFPHKKDSFPRPAIILSDHAALYVFNDENYSAILARAYRIFTNAAIRNDLSNTNIHAYLSHFILDMHKRVNEYLPEDIIDEEEELNKADSPLKQELQAIYNEWLTTCIKYNGAFSSFDKASKGTRQWLSHINQQCIPPIPIWSNILLGDYIKSTN